MDTKIVLRIVLPICFLMLKTPDGFSQQASSPLKIWFTRPAETWNEALPVGNGRLGAMISGGIENERIQLNEESVWTGNPRWDANPDARMTLPEVRKLLFEGKYREAEKLAQSGILGSFRRDDASTYQTLCDLTFHFGPYRNVSNYKRELNIENAVAVVSYTSGQVNYSREIFSSYPDQALVIRLDADKEGSLNFSVRLSRPGNSAVITTTGNEITMREHVGNGNGVKMETRLRLLANGGNIASGGDSIRIEKANSVTIYLTAATDYSGKDPASVSSDTYGCYRKTLL